MSWVLKDALALEATEERASKLRESINGGMATSKYIGYVHQVGSGVRGRTVMFESGVPGYGGAWIFAQDLGFRQKLTNTGQNLVALQGIP